MNKFRDSDAEEETGHDIFNPGVSDDQRQRAEEMLGGLSFGMFVEQRSLDNEYRAGVLIGLDGSDPVEVAVSPMIDETLREHVVLCDRPLHAQQKAQIITRRAGRETRLMGSLSASRPGRREEDRKADPPIHVARFYDNA
ncbi:hypothetical protein HFP89_01730 [Wenzhouxiangella sp. XN79A]|uniref:hypothetical protein n=1 Tax=Wenzhouxiangella sp. XN79A TaxID=2724193 RepID=UPI00144A8FFE|nr:hypothetical protein [Wenzhouxiangella sp. XN79A]NKI33883.1 hypothetical protein [Wenzhouxiangella sp. XN79A]